MAADDVLRYVDPDERHMRISMRDVDRAATAEAQSRQKTESISAGVSAIERRRVAGFISFASLSWFPCVFERE